MTLTPTEAVSDKADNWLRNPTVRLLRYALVLIIVAAAIWGSLAGWFRVCSEVTSVADGLTTTCTAQPDLTNAGVLAAVMLVLLLLWPDLAEFSAFGVTLKRMVEKVGEDVRDNGRAAREAVTRIETAGSSIASLERSIEGHEAGLGRRLESMDGLLAAIQTQQRRHEPSGSSARARIPGWRARDEFELDTLAARLDMSTQQLQEMAEALRGRAAVELEGIGPLQHRGEWIVLVGILIALFTTANERPTAVHSGVPGDDPHPRQPELDDLMALIERMILAIIDGKPVAAHAIAKAAAILWLVADREG